MKLPIKVGIGAALLWIVLKMVGLALNISVDDIKMFVFINMFLLTAAIAYSLFQLKRKEVESNLLNDIKNGMLAGVPYTLIVSVFLYFYYEKKYFPFITFFVALVLDVLDFADFTGVGWIIMSGVEIIFSIILFFLMFGKVDTMFKMSSKALFRGRSRKRLGKRRKNTGGIGGGVQKMAKKYLQKYMSRRLVATLLINIIPIIGILASNAFFVVLVHNKQKKIAQKYMHLVNKVSDILKDFDKNR